MSFSDERIRVAVLGAGGLGKAACRIIGMKKELLLCGVCDSKGFVVSSDGLDTQRLASINGDLVSGYRQTAVEVKASMRSEVVNPAIAPTAEGIGPVGLLERTGGRDVAPLEADLPVPQARPVELSIDDCRFSIERPSSNRQSKIDNRKFQGVGVPVPQARAGGLHTLDRSEVGYSDDPLRDIIHRSEMWDAVLIALPNLPNGFIPGVIERFSRAHRPLVFVDVLKRTPAVRKMFALDALIKEAQAVVLTGCGATPGILAAAAVLAAQSFVEVERVDIWWGVGISNWDAYKATIREDIAHLPGYSLERAKAMTDAEVEAILSQRDGLLELRHMEHADDLLLQRVGVVDRLDQVEVGGLMDTRHPKKPVSTTMTLTGITFEGKRASHRFILGDETSMAANVIGPALGYLKRGIWLKAHGIFGVFGCTEFLPMVVR